MFRFCVPLLLAATTVRSSHFHTTILMGLSNPPAGVECVDNVCKIVSPSDSIKAEVVDLESKIMKEWKAAGSTEIDSASPAIATAVTDIVEENIKPEVIVTAAAVEEVKAPEAEQIDVADIEAKVDELKKMGYSSDDAKLALKKSNNDVGAAAAILEADEEENEDVLKKASELGALGWNEEASQAAVRQCGGNSTQAVELLEKEEVAMLEQFESAVKDMLDNGWEEVVARQALLAQWTLDQRKTMGSNTTIASDILANIKPTLRRSNETATARKAKSGPKNPSKDPKSPTPAKKEDCVFECTSANFQKLVLESPVPVLVDVYADWCGPCKQLTPLLETAAMKSGGMFRLIKINTDKEPSLSQTLGVSGLPTVFAVNNGKLTDRFVGMLPQDQLQQFIVRAVTGHGDRVQGDVNDAMLKESTQKISIMAGLATFSFSKKQKLNSWVDAALDLEGGMDEIGNLSGSVQTALLYIDNAAKDVRNEKFRLIKTNTDIFKSRIGDSACALRLLDIAGFKVLNSTTDAPPPLALVHSNSAILNLVSQRVTHSAQEKKFARMKMSPPVGGNTNKSLRKPIQIPSIGEKKEVKNEVKKEVKKELKTTIKKQKGLKTEKKTEKALDREGKISVNIRTADGLPLKKFIDENTKLKEAMKSILDSDVYEEWSTVEIRYPSPRRILTKKSKEMEMSVSQLGGSEGLSLSFPIKSPDSDSDQKKKISSAFSIFGKKKVVPKDKKVVGGTHTLHSTGAFDVSKKKNTEYFGGDSTVTQAGPEEEEEEEEDDEDDEDEEGDDNEENDEEKE